MSRDVADNLASAGGMADHRGIFKIKMVHQLGQIVCVLIHIVALPSLARASVAATIMGDDAITSLARETTFVRPKHRRSKAIRVRT